MKNTIMKNWATFLQEENGQDLVEYALIAALISVALVASLTGLKDNIVAVFAKVKTALGV